MNSAGVIIEMTKRCAFLSTCDLEDFFVHDQLLFTPLQKYGWAVEEVSWKNTSIDWNEFDVVVIRSTWDYQAAPQAFMQCLEKIEASRAHLENSLALVKWNISKDY